mmetsp:Transcript_26483/g.49507  ORF Transcript_26483/g.49507 Transcript_26483/m.49507 type:complete len:88 (+) Transcript_26483:114-377(+)
MYTYDTDRRSILWDRHRIRYIHRLTWEARTVDGGGGIIDEIRAVVIISVSESLQGSVCGEYNCSPHPEGEDQPNTLILSFNGGDRLG